MSNIPISSLPIAVSLTGSEAVPLVQAGTTKSATVSLINSQNVANIPAGGLTGQGLVKSSNVDFATMWKTISGFGTVQEVDTGTGLTGGPITLTGTLSLAPITSHTLLANITGGSAAPIPNTPSSVLDIIGSIQGDLLYRDSGGWQVLAPGTNGQILKTQGPAANPIWSATGSGSVTSVGLALPPIFTISGSPVTVSGTLTGALATQNANLVWAGPTTGAASAPTFRSLVGADLPNPSSTTLGGIQSTTGASHQWISSISTSGVPELSQPAFTDISGTVAAAQLPNPALSTLGGIEAINAVASNWIRSITTSGVPQLSQPAFSDISGNAALAQLPTIGNNTILANVSGGSATPLATSQSALLDTIAAVQGDVLYRNASNWVALAPGTNGQVLTTGGPAANLAWGTVTGTGTVTSVGPGTGISTSPNPITGAGTVSLASIATGNVLAYTGAGSGIPVATTPSAVLDVIGSTQGSVLYRGASTWTALTPGTSGQFLQTTGGGSTPQWATGLISAGTGLTVSGSSIGLSFARQTLPTTQSLTSGSAATYTTPAGCLWIEVFMVGGGGGGSGAGTSALVNGSDGTKSTFNSIDAAPGKGATSNTGGPGGTGGTGAATRRGRGGAGGNGVRTTGTTTIAGGGIGGSSYFSHGPNTNANGTSNAGTSGDANSGAGGSGGQNYVGSFVEGGGGGAGEFAYLLIDGPSATYLYTIGAGGAGGSATDTGGTGGSGLIFVIEHYGS